MSKERIAIPPQLQARIEGLVKAHAKALGTTEEDARRLVEVSILSQGVAELERRKRAEEPA